jgi:hypothetical protein
VVINQVNKSWDRNKENMDAYCLEVRKLENKFYGLECHHIACDSNVAADVLSKLGSTRAQVPVGVFVHELHAPSIPEQAPPTTDPAHPPVGQEVMMIDVDWRQPFIDYLREQKVPSDKNLAEQLIRRTKTAAHGMVLDALKKRLHDAANTKGGKWIKELPNALWGLRTQPSKPTGQSPYFLVYDSEAILPADVMWDSPAVEQYDEGISEDSR